MSHHHHAAPHGPTSTPSAVLEAEHDVIRQLLRALNGMAHTVERVPIPRQDLDDALETIAGFADACHHAKEEKVLFPALRRASKESERVVRELEGDHKAGRKIVRAMRDAAPGAASGDVASQEGFAHAARLYAKMLEMHIRHENERLYPLMERVLSPAERERVAEEFERVEREETGAGVHQKYERIVERLAGTYAA